MPSVTNYLKNVKNMRLFFRSLAMGLHTRNTAPKRGIKKSLHDDYLKRLAYFNMGSKIRDTQIGRTRVHTITKQDFYWGHNYLADIYALYAMKPEAIILILAIINIINKHTSCTMTELYNYINDDPYILPAYQDFLEEKYKYSHKPAPSIIEKQTITRIMKKLVTIGVIDEVVQKNVHVYRLSSIGLESSTDSLEACTTDVTSQPTDLASCTMDELEQLTRAIFIYKNMALFSTAGHTLLAKLQSFITDTSLLDELEQPMPPNYESQYVFIYNNPLHSIDEGILYTLAEAFHHHKMVELSFCNKRRPKVTVRPVRIESDYIGNRDYLIAVHHNTLVTYRIDAISTITTKGSFNIDAPIPTAKARHNTMLHLRFHKLDGYEPAWTKFTDTFRHMPINCESSTPEYLDMCIQVQDGQILLPLLRTFLPYIEITESTPESIRTRFNDNLRYTQHETVSEPSSYTKKAHPSWNLLSLETDKTDGSTSLLLNEITAITCATQYRIQRDLINGVAYTLDDLRFIMNHRPLLDSYAPVEENDQYEHALPSYLVRPEAHGLEPLFPELPPLVTTAAECMFLKDLLNDDRINWMVPHNVYQILSHALNNVPTTLPTHTWCNRSLAIDETPTSYENHRRCTEAMIRGTSISWNTEGTTITILPCKMGYNGATNGYSLIGYHLDDNTFGYYPMHTLPIVTVGTEPIDIDTVAVYREYQETNLQTVTFSVYDINNAIDRCFNAFSNYDIVGTETDTNEFTLSVEYLPFQEMDILRILLSLGAAVRVHEPQLIKEKLDNIYKQAISLIGEK